MFRAIKFPVSDLLAQSTTSLKFRLKRNNFQIQSVRFFSYYNVSKHVRAEQKHLQNNDRLQSGIHGLGFQQEK